MKGFFEKENIEKGNQQSNCLKCRLYKTCVSPKMKLTGKGEKKIFVIAEAPGKKEDEENTQLIGQAGQLLRRTLQIQGIDLDKDCWKTNAVNCRPPNNRVPTKKEINLCHPRLEEYLKKKRPHLIILLGNSALESFIGNRLSDTTGGINKWRGFVIPEQKYNAWVIPTFHPSYLLRNQKDKMIQNLFEQDIKTGLDKLKKKVPKYEYKINIHHNDEDVITLLRHLSQNPPELLAFDYETTGLKPYTEGHEIICCGLYDGKEADVFKMNNKVTKYWKRILKNKCIRKTAQNIKFEHQWGRNILRVTTKGWKWDTMQASHILDNRSGITGLKFQAYINFGQVDYSSHLEKYLKSENENGFNNIKEADVQEVMQYCGMDVILEYRLAKKQMKQLTDKSLL